MDGGRDRLPFLLPLAMLGLFVMCLIALFPKESLQAGLTGVSIWWDVLFPSLFPFFVVSELMLGFGIVHFFGTLLDPMMRPLFRLPGPGGFVMALGFASGYPVGARLTGQLWDAGMVNRKESERLIAFTTTGDPIFLIGAVAVGFFNDPGLAAILAVSHYGGALLLGLLLRFWDGGEPAESGETVSPKDDGKPILLRAFDAMHRTRIGDGRSVGRMLFDGIRSGLHLIIVVGGLVVFFSVVIEVLTLARIIPVLYSAVSAALSFLSLPAPLAAAVINGFFEVTLGAKTAGTPLPGVSLQAQIAVASFGLSWAGLSVHAQIMSIVSHMPVRYSFYAVSKLVHGVFSGGIAFLLWDWLQPIRQSAYAWIPAGESSGWSAAQAYFPLSALCFVAALATIPIAYLFYRLAGFLFRLFRSLRSSHFH